MASGSGHFWQNKARRASERASETVLLCVKSEPTSLLVAAMDDTTTITTTTTSTKTNASTKASKIKKKRLNGESKEGGARGGIDGDDDKDDDDEECDVEAWDTLSKSFRQVQTVLDQNRDLIKQVNANHQSKIPDNLAKNVSLIREIDGNISKVMSIYSDLSVNFSSKVQERRRFHNSDDGGAGGGGGGGS